MTITRAPLRISFFGGGSDLPAYRALTGASGCVLSCTIDQYVYAAADRVWSSIKPGSGLGGSGAAAVARARQATSDPQAVLTAALAHERALCPSAGWQDVAAATFGGLNLISDDGLTVTPIPIPHRLDSHLLLFGTGQTRQAAPILRQQAQTMRDHLDALTHSIDLARAVAQQWLSGHTVNLGALLDSAWRAKRAYSPGISTPAIDATYTAALQAGASGGKLCGAGGGGYLLLCAEPSEHRAIRRAMILHGLRERSFHLTGAA